MSDYYANTISHYGIFSKQWLLRFTDTSITNLQINSGFEFTFSQGIDQQLSISYFGSVTAIYFRNYLFFKITTSQNTSLASFGAVHFWWRVIFAFLYGIMFFSFNDSLSESFGPFYILNAVN